MYVHQTKWFNCQLVRAVFAITSGFFLIFALNFENAGRVPVDVALGLAGITLCSVGIRLLLQATHEIGPFEVKGTSRGF
jgi:hypothetical protein